jgi:hypothetical protein
MAHARGGARLSIGQGGRKERFKVIAASNRVISACRFKTRRSEVNRITDRILTGTVGELLVQIRLLQHGVQAAPPIKDSGNDLIAVNGCEFRAVSVRTTTTGRFQKPDCARLYHVLAVVHLVGDDREIFLDRSRVFLIPQEQVAEVPDQCDRLDQYLFSEELLRRLFG